MAGERNLEALLRGMAPSLHPDEFVYSTHDRVVGDPICTFREREGLTLILRRAEAENLGLPFTYPCRMITLTIHSSLEAVGLMAAVAGRLAERGISVNVVSGYFHDHLFVERDRADEALDALTKF